MDILQSIDRPVFQRWVSGPGNFISAIHFSTKESRLIGKAALFTLETIKGWQITSLKHSISCAVSLPSQELLTVFLQTSFVWGSVCCGLMHCSKTTCSSFLPSSPAHGLAAYSYLCITVPLHQHCCLCSCTGSQPGQLTVRKNAPARERWDSSNREGTSIVIQTGRGGGLAQAAAAADVHFMLSGYHGQHFQEQSPWEEKTGQNHLLKRQETSLQHRTK